MFPGQFKGKSTYGPGGELENELIFTTVDGLMWQSTERPSGQVTDYIYDDRGISSRLKRCSVQKKTQKYLLYSRKRKKADLLEQREKVKSAFAVGERLLEFREAIRSKHTIFFSV